MKKIISLALLSFLTLASIAQNKFGYIDSQELLLLMPERKNAETEVQNFAKSLEAQLGSMTAEYQESVQEYQANEVTYTDLVKQDKVAEITGLEQRIQTFQQNAQQSLQQKEQESLLPKPKHEPEIFLSLENYQFALQLKQQLIDTNNSVFLPKQHFLLADQLFRKLN